MHSLNPGMAYLSCKAALWFASPSLRQAVQACSCADGRAGCAGANFAVVLLVMGFSDDYVLICEGVRVIDRREISALEGTDLSLVLEKCSLSLLCAMGFGKT